MMLQAAPLRHDGKHKISVQPAVMTMVVPQRCQQEENERAVHGHSTPPHKLPLPSLCLPLPPDQLRLPTPQGRRRWSWLRDAGQTTSWSKLLATDDLCEGEVAKQDADGGQGESIAVILERSGSRDAANQGREKIRSFNREAIYVGEPITVRNGTREASHGIGSVTREGQEERWEPRKETVAKDVADKEAFIKKYAVTGYTEEAVTRPGAGTVNRYTEEPGIIVIAVDGCAAAVTRPGAGTVNRYTEEPGIIVIAVDGCAAAVTRPGAGTVNRYTEEPGIVVIAVDGCAAEAIKRIKVVAQERECKQDRWASSRPGRSPSPGVLPSPPPPQSSRAAGAVRPISLERWPSREMVALGHHLLHGLGPSLGTAYKRTNVEQAPTSSGSGGATHGGNAPHGGEAACVTNLTRVHVTTRRVMMINGTSTLPEPSRLKQQPQPRSAQWRPTKPPQSLQTQLSPDADEIATRHVGNAFAAINKECSQREADTNEIKAGSRNNYETDCYKRNSLSDRNEVLHNLCKGKTREKFSRTSSFSHKSCLRLLLGLVECHLADTLVRLVLMFVLMSRSSVTAAAAASSTMFSSQQVAFEQGDGVPAVFHFPKVDALRPPEKKISDGAHLITQTHPEMSTMMTTIDVNSKESNGSINERPRASSSNDMTNETTSADGWLRVPTNVPEDTSSPGGRSRNPTDAPDETSSPGGRSRDPTDAPDETSSPSGRSRANREALRADGDPRSARRPVRMVGTTWELHRRLQKEREEAAARWAPVVWLHPQELYFPDDVHTFLAQVNSSEGAQTWERDGRSGRQYRLLPSGPDSEHMHLDAPIDTECCNCPVPSFLHGQSPVRGVGPPVYAHIHSCYAPEKHIAETSKIQYLLPAHSDGRSMRDRMHELLHPLPLPPRYRRRRRHHITVRGRRDAPQAPDVASEAPSQGKNEAVSSKPYEAGHQTNTESPLNNFVENKQILDGAQGESKEDARAITKIGQFLKWNKVTLRKPQSKMLSPPDFKKTPRNLKEGRKIDADSSVLNAAAAAHSNPYSPTKGVNDAHLEAVTYVDQQDTITTNTENTPESSSSSAEPPSNEDQEESSFDTRVGPSTTVVSVELVETDGPVTVASDSKVTPVTVASDSKVTDGDSKHEKRNIDSSSYYSHNSGSEQESRGKVTVTPVFPIFDPNTGGPTIYPNTGDHHSETNTATGTRGHHFTITYWFFYPFNQGKAVCTSNVWLLGRVAKPLFHGKCLGQNIVMGNHVGDWEHVSIFFEHGSPKHLYISAHNFGALYTYRPKSSRFEYVSQDVREGLPVRAEFPQHLELEDGRLVLYSAKGSHGLWPEQGDHLYNSMVVPLSDETGQGARWDTWHNLEMIDTVAQDDPENNSLSRQWLGYRGRWGNPSSNCHPGLLGFCELRDGPTGIPTKRLNFPCHVPNHYTFPNA